MSTQTPAPKYIYVASNIIGVDPKSIGQIPGITRLGGYHPAAAAFFAHNDTARIGVVSYCINRFGQYEVIFEMPVFDSRRVSEIKILFAGRHWSIHQFRPEAHG